MFPLIYFIAGILFVRIVMPILDQITSWIITAIDKRKGKIAVTLTEYEKEIKDIVGGDAPVTRQIGFVVNDPSEYDTESPEEEEEDV